MKNLFAVLAALLLTAPSAFSQEAGRTLNDHTFMPNLATGDAFVTTNIRSTTGFGSTVGLSLPLYDFKGNYIKDVETALGYFVLELQYQQTIAEKFTLHAAFSGAVRSGTTVVSLLSEGVNASYGLTGGVGYQIAREKNWSLMAGVDLSKSSLILLTPYDWAKKLIDSEGKDTSAVLVSDVGRLNVMANGRWAWTPSPSWGVQTLLGLGYAGANDVSIEGRFLGVAAVSGEYDLQPETDIPIGIQATYKYSSSTGRDQEVAAAQNVYVLGLFYTGRRLFSIGFTTSYVQLNRAFGTEPIRALISNINLRYDL
ncbi:MAG: hypothetical protein JSS89_12355 [Bacteroidetes bacterium]|nr:hypothetical protein [Bacteroidota bacterium]